MATKTSTTNYTYDNPYVSGTSSSSSSSYSSSSSSSNPAYTLGQQQDFFNALRGDLSYLFGDTSKYSNYDYGINYDANSIRNALNAATNAAYDQSRTEGTQNMLTANRLALGARNQTIADMRNNLMTSALSGANAGQVNANILSAFLANQQAGAESQTAALQQLQNIAEQRRAALIKNASDAINTANNAAISRGELLNAEQANRVAALSGTLGQALYGTGQGNAGAVNASENSSSTSNSTSNSTSYDQNVKQTKTTTK